MSRCWAKGKSTECSNKCGRERRAGQRTCRECHAANEKTRRKALAALRGSKGKIRI